jgi:general stress protein YciG
MHKAEAAEVISVNEAGRRGGLAVLRARGRGHFIELGRKGQRATRLRYPKMAAEWGKLGGRPRKPKLEDMGEEAKISKEGRMGPAPK